MAATLESLVLETKRNKLSLIGQLSEEEVMLVWEKVAWFVETLMMQKKAVNISGVGTFTFSKRKIEVGNNRAIVIQRPVFVLSEKFKQTHSLHCVKKHASGQVPLHTLNYTHLSNETGISRELVEGAVREVLQALSRAVANGKSVEFDLKDVGRLTIHDGKAKMSFFREFVYRLDGCCEVDGLFRSGSTDSSICSIMSNPRCSSSNSRPSTTLSLPKLVQPVEDGEGEMNLSLECSGGTSSNCSSPHGHSSYNNSCLIRQLKMATISEEEEEEEDEDRHSCEGVYAVDKNGVITTAANSLPGAPNGNSKSSKPTTAASGTNTQSKTLVPMPAMLIVRDRESPNAILTPSTAHRSMRDSTSTSSSSRRGHSKKARTKISTRSSSSSKCSRCYTSSSCSGSCSCSMGPTPHHVSRPSTCSHTSSAGQELCYLCYQRAIKNVPVDLSKEKEAMEKQYNDTIHEYQHRRELLAMARAQAEKTKKLLLEQDIASFNQTRANNTKKQKCVKSSKMDPSYIFSDRAITPAPQASQQRYCRELDHQVETKTSWREREKEDEEKSGREEQERLARELAAHEELYKRIKAQSVEDYKAALHEQVTLKSLKNVGCEKCMVPLLTGGGSGGGGRETVAVGELESPMLPLVRRSLSSRSLKVPPRNTLRPFTPPPPQPPHNINTQNSKRTHLKKLQINQDAVVPQTIGHACQNDSHQQHPVFGVRLSSPETGERERAKAFFLDQLAMVEEKQRRAREKALAMLQEESDMLRTTKDGLKEDLKKEKSRRTKARQALEKEWLVSVREKQRRLLEDLHRAREQGIRLHQQCEHYQRCKQCQRKHENFGKSNILHETCYISGSRLMV